MSLKIPAMMKTLLRLCFVLLVYLVFVTEAQQGCFCTFNFDPVCGSDGRTYSNSCNLDCERQRNPNLQAVFRGECGTRPGNPGNNNSPPGREFQPPNQNQNQECLCFDIFDPVCGANGVTYNNECRLRCDFGGRIAHQGPCRGGQQRPPIINRPNNNNNNNNSNNNRPNNNRPNLNRPNNNNNRPINNNNNRPNNNRPINNRPPINNNRPNNNNNNNNRPTSNNRRPPIFIIQFE